MKLARKLAGFTLIELMVAVFITAILLSMGYGAVNQALKDRDGLTVRQERLLAVQTTMRLLTQDFMQLTPRPVREPLGDGMLPAIIGAPGTNSIVTLTRAGWANPAGIQRPTLQRVTYVLENGTLRREHWPVLDATSTTTTVRRELLDKVKAMTLRYMDNSFQWRDQWPDQALQGDSSSNWRLRPIAVEVTLELDDWGKLVRLIEVAG
jgi:general secretion pathway protein J